MNSSIIIAAVILIAAVVGLVIHKQRIRKDISQNKKYKPPLSDDVQRIYYDHFEEEMNKEDHHED